MRRLHDPPESHEDDQHMSVEADSPQLLEAPSPYTTVALVSAKEGLDHFGQLEVPDQPIPKAIEIVISVGHVALGVGLFGALLWGMTTIGAAISAHATARPGHEVRGERDEKTAARDS